MMNDIPDCLSPCYRGPRNIGNMEDLHWFFQACWQYMKDLFTQPIGQFDLIDVMLIAGLAAIVIRLLNRE